MPVLRNETTSRFIHDSLTVVTDVGEVLDQEEGRCCK
jgi:hypothetical protein